MNRLHGRTALITGGATGIGNAIAVRLSAEGARVCISDIDPDRGQVAAAEGCFRFFQHDVRDEARWQQIIDEILAGEGGLDILVNNAGIVGPGDRRSPELLLLDDWRSVFSVNVEGTFIGCRTAIAAMRERGGVIVNLSSAAALLATPAAIAYGASKAAVAHLTRSIAQYCLEQGLRIRCNSVHPGNVLTELWRKRAEEQVKARGGTIEDVLVEGQVSMPGGDFIMPEDVAAAVAFLVSDDARHVTGEKLVVDGGVVGCDTLFIGKYAALMKDREGGI